MPVAGLPPCPWLTSYKTMISYPSSPWVTYRQARNWVAFKVSSTTTVFNLNTLSEMNINFFLPFSLLISELIVFFPCFSFPKPRLVWILSKLGYFHNSNLNSFHHFPFNRMSLSLNFLCVYFLFCSLATPYVSYLSRLWPNEPNGRGQPQPMTVTTF